MHNEPVRIAHPLLAGVSALRARWQRWHQASTNRKVLAASVLLAGLTVVCKLAAAGREIASAYYFGTGDSMDAMVIALMVPMFAVTVLARTAGTALLPSYIQLQEQTGRQQADELLRDWTFWNLLITIATAVGLALTAGRLLPWISPGFEPAKQHLTVRLLCVLLPALVLYGLASLWEAVLHSGERFAATGWTPAIAPLVAMVVVVAGAVPWGIYALAVGTVAGVGAEVVVLGWSMHRAGYPLRPRLGRWSPAVGQVGRQYLPLVGAAALMGSTTLVDNAMAGTLGPGSVATLGYGNKLVAVAMSIPILSVSRAIFPYFSRAIATHQWTTVRHVLGTYRRLVWWGTLPLTVALVLAAKPLTACALQRGAFDASSTEAVAWVQSFYALQIPVYAVGILYVRLLSSLRRNVILAVGTVISIVLNVALNCALMGPLGVAGIALSTALVYTVSCAYLVLAGTRALRAAVVSPTAGTGSNGPHRPNVLGESPAHE